MNNTGRIIIFSRPVHSGKTSALQDWCYRQKDIAGVLMPDVEGKRKLLNLQTNELHDFECAYNEDNPASVTTVGRFNFYSAVFDLFNEVMIKSVLAQPQWLVIDEVGKLELAGKGFYPAVKAILSDHENNKFRGNVLLVVRDSLCNEVISFFNISTYNIVEHLDAM